MQERGPDPKGGHRCYKWGHEPDRNAIVCASTRGHEAGRSGAHQRKRGCLQKQPGRLWETALQAPFQWVLFGFKLSGGK